MIDACAVLIAAISAWYDSEDAGAGAGTSICVGPVSTIMRQVPALASAPDGLDGASVSWVGMSLLQPFEARAAATRAAASDGARRWALMSVACA